MASGFATHALLVIMADDKRSLTFPHMAYKSGVHACDMEIHAYELIICHKARGSKYNVFFVIFKNMHDSNIQLNLYNMSSISV